MNLLPLSSFLQGLVQSVLIVSMLAPLSVFASSKPESAHLIFEATYKAKISGFGAELVRSLEQMPDGDYRLHSRASNFFAYIDETSQFLIEDGKVKPQSYYYERSIAGKKSQESLEFNWQTMSGLYIKDNHQEPDATHTLETNILDPATYQLFLQADVSSEIAPLEYTFIKRKRVETYIFEQRPDETLEIAGKEYASKVFERKDDHEVKQTKVWIVPELDYQIGKIEHTSKKGSTYGMDLQSYKADKESLKVFYQKARASLKTSQTKPLEKANPTEND